MTIETFPFDAAEYLDTPESQAELIADALESGNASYIAAAIGVVARARGASSVARDAGVSRETMYKAFIADGDPRLSTLVNVLKALGMELTARPAPEKADEPA
jgi:probable addiction module antidote protein